MLVKREYTLDDIVNDYDLEDKKKELLEELIKSIKDYFREDEKKKTGYEKEFNSKIDELIPDNICQTVPLDTKGSNNSTITENRKKDEEQPTLNSNSENNDYNNTQNDNIPNDNIPNDIYNNPNGEEIDDSNKEKRSTPKLNLNTIQDYRKLIEHIEENLILSEFKDNFQDSVIQKKFDAKTDVLKCDNNKDQLPLGKNTKDTQANNKNTIGSNNSLKYGLIGGGIGLIVILGVILLLMLKKGKKTKNNKRNIPTNNDLSDNDDIKITHLNKNTKESFNSSNIHQDISYEVKTNSNSQISTPSVVNPGNNNQSPVINTIISEDLTNTSKLRDFNQINNNSLELNNVNTNSPVIRNVSPNYISNSTSSSMMSLPVQPVLSSQMQSQQKYSSQMHSPQMHSPQMHSPQMNSPQMNSPQMHSPQMHSPQMHSPQMNSPQMNTPKMNTPKMNTPQMPSPKMNYTNVNRDSFIYKNSPVLEKVLNNNIHVNNYQNMASNNNNPDFVAPSVSSNHISNEASLNTVATSNDTTIVADTAKSNNEPPSYIETLAKKIQPNEHVFVAQYYYNPKFNDEFQISPGDVISFGQCTYDDGWAHGSNLTKETTGVFPLGVVIRIVDVNGNNRDIYQVSEKYRCKPRSSSHTVKYQASTSDHDPSFEKSSLELNYLLGKLNVEEYLYLNSIERKKLESKININNINNININMNINSNGNSNSMGNENGSGSSQNESGNGSSSSA